MNLQPRGLGFESQTGKMKLAIEPKLSFKSKNGFNKQCSETNCASECQVFSLIWKIRLTLLFMNFVVKRKWEEKKGWLSFAARKRSNNGLSKSHVLPLDGVEATSVASISCSTFLPNSDSFCPGVPTSCLGEDITSLNGAPSSQRGKRRHILMK